MEGEEDTITRRAVAIFANLNTPYSIFTFTRWMSPNSLQPVQRKLRGIGRLRSRIRRVMIIYHHHSRGSAFGQRGLRLYYGLTGMRNCAPRFPYQFSPVRVNFENVCDIICERRWLSLRGIDVSYYAGACEIYLNFPLWRVNFIYYISRCWLDGCLEYSIGNVFKRDTWITMLINLLFL